MKAIRIHAAGGPEVLMPEEVPDPSPGPGQVLVRVEATGINFIEIYQRSGQYPLPMPMTPGAEAAGVVVAVGEGVTGLVVGDRVASVNFAGAYAELSVAAADPAPLVRWIRAEVVEALPQLDRIDLYDTPGCGVSLCWGELGPALPA